MKKKLNVKLFACILGGLIAFGTCIHFVHAYQVRRNVDAFLRLSDEAQEAKDLRKAVDYLGRYLALAPDDIDAQAKYAILLSDKEVASTGKTLLRAYLALGQVLLHHPSRH